MAMCHPSFMKRFSVIHWWVISMYRWFHAERWPMGSGTWHLHVPTEVGWFVILFVQHHRVATTSQLVHNLEILSVLPLPILCVRGTRAMNAPIWSRLTWLIEVHAHPPRQRASYRLRRIHGLGVTLVQLLAPGTPHILFNALALH